MTTCVNKCMLGSLHIHKTLSNININSHIKKNNNCTWQNLYSLVLACPSRQNLTHFEAHHIQLLINYYVHEYILQNGLKQFKTNKFSLPCTHTHTISYLCQTCAVDSNKPTYPCNCLVKLNTLQLNMQTPPHLKIICSMKHIHESCT